MCVCVCVYVCVCLYVCVCVVFVCVCVCVQCVCVKIRELREVKYCVQKQLSVCVCGVTIHSEGRLLYSLCSFDACSVFVLLVLNKKLSAGGKNGLLRRGCVYTHTHTRACYINVSRREIPFCFIDFSHLFNHGLTLRLL